MALGFEFAAKIIIVFDDFFAAFDALFVTEDVELGQRTSGLGRVDGRGVEVGVAHVPDEFQHFLVADADEADVCGEAFTASPTQDHVREVFEPLSLPSTLSSFTKVSEVVGAVDEKVGVVLFGDSLILDKIWVVGVHGEEAFCDDEDGVVGVLFASLFEHASHFVLVEVGEALEVAGGGDGALLQTVVGDVVHDDVVVRPDQGVDYAETRHPPSWVDQHVGLPVLLQFALQLQVESE